MSLSRVTVDDKEYTLDFVSFERPLKATSADGRSLELRPWTLGEHFQALGSCACIVDGALQVDPVAYASEVLGGADPGDWTGLVLWWASGGGGAQEAAHAPVRPWSLSERAKVLRTCISAEDGSFDLGRYLSEMVRVCSMVTGDPLSLSTRHGLPLQVRVNAANTPDDVLEQDPELRQVALRLATTLGWPPARTLATPASEVDQLLALLDSAAPQRAPSAPRQPAPPVPASTPAAFALDPDATIIRIDGD